MGKSPLFVVAALLVAVLVGPAVSSAQSTDTKEQPSSEKAGSNANLEKWFGTLDVQVAKLRLVVETTTNADGSMTAEMISLDQGNSRIPMDDYSEGEGEVSFTIKKISAEFTGKLSDDGKTLTGKFTQLNVPRDLTFKRVTEIPTMKCLEAWVGDLDVGGQILRVQFRTMEKEDGETEVLFDSLSQQAQGIAATMAITDDGVSGKVPAIQGKYEAKFNEDKTQLDGTWTQGKEFPLRLKKVDKPEKAAKLNRPQTPKPPFAYASEDVSFENTKQEVTLGGTLTYPSEGGPFPCVITITGSGPQDRDETIFGHKIFAVMADHLAKAGIATLRYDDRGIGDSTGSFAKATSADFAEDAAAAIEFVKANEHIDATRIGLVGHSEGGLIATMLAASRSDLAHVVLLAGPGARGDQIIMDQTAAMARVMGIDKDELAEQAEVMRELCEAAKVGLDAEQTKEILKRHPDMMDESMDEGGAIVSAQMNMFTTPWFKFFLNYDPAPDMSKAACPVLALIGEKDLQVTTDLNLPIIENALKNSGQAGSKAIKLAGLNHLFQPCKSGSPLEYAAIEQTVDPKVLDLLVGWVNEH